MLALSVAGCMADAAESDGAFYDWDHRRVHCAVGIDDVTRIDHASIDSALDRAVARGEVAELYGHSPGRTLDPATVEYVVTGARVRGLAFVTYAELANATVAPGPAIALSFDDNQTETWITMRDLFLANAARVTFFVSRYDRMSEERRADLRLLAADGHVIEAHSLAHLRAPRFVEEHGLAAYISEEALPSIDLLRADGYPVTSFAYPFGARTEELDDALLEHVRLVRSVSFSFELASSPCPR